MYVRISILDSWIMQNKVVKNHNLNLNNTILCIIKFGWAAYPSYQVPQRERRVPFLLVKSIIQI